MNFKVECFLKVLLTCIYVIGVGCVIFYGGMYLQHSTYVPNPDAMLPMMQYEAGAWALMFGIPFMIASCVSIVWIFTIRKLWCRLCVFLPAIVAFVIIVSYWI